MAEKDDEEDEYEDDDEEYEDDDEWEDDEDEEEDPEARAAREAAEAKAAKKKKLMLIGGAVGAVAVLVGLWFGAKALGLTEKIFGKPNITEVTVNLGKEVTATLPLIRTDLRRVGHIDHFIKLNIIVQLNEKDLPTLSDPIKQAKIVDGIKTYLRGMDFQDLEGKKGSERLRFDLVTVINHAVAPVQIHTILFKDFIVQ